MPPTFCGRNSEKFSFSVDFSVPTDLETTEAEQRMIERLIGFYHRGYDWVAIKNVGRRDVARHLMEKGLIDAKFSIATEDRDLYFKTNDISLANPDEIRLCSLLRQKVASKLSY